MNKINSLKLITLILMIVLIISVANRVFAADGIQTLTVNSGNTNSGSQIGTVNNANETGNSNGSQIGTINNANETGNVNTGNSVVGGTNTNSNLPVSNTVNNKATNQNIPYAGLSSNSTILFLLVATSISAIYTYKKVKEYNN